MAETNEQDLAYRWLLGEDDYQWTKFPVHYDIGLLYEDDAWKNIVFSYWNRSQLYRKKSLTHTVHYLGKTAATLRGLLVTLTTLRTEGKPDRHFNMANVVSFEVLNQSLRRLTSAEVQAHQLQVQTEWQMSDFGDTEAGRHFGAIPLPYTEGAHVPVDHIASAKKATQAGMFMLAGAIGETIRQGLPLPRPGLSGGNIEPWGYA